MAGASGAGLQGAAELPVSDLARTYPKSPDVVVRRGLPTASVVFETYWRFAAERQAIFFRRLAGAAPPWTSDPILSQYKFTNAYRASDRVSQFLIRNVIYDGDPSAEETFFRIILFKLFNRIDTWRMLKAELGDIRYSAYSFKLYDSILTRRLETGGRLYSAAYIMPGGRLGSFRKHQEHLAVLERMMRDRVALQVAECGSMCRAFEILRSYPLIGDFLAYQYVTDINYSEVTRFTEMDFVVPGPGARDGIRKCFLELGQMTESDVVRFATEKQEEEFDRLGIHFQSLWGRPLQLIDCQNLFCEVDKYARVAHPEIAGLTMRKRIKQKYRPLQQEPISYWYPPKWKLDYATKQTPGDIHGAN